MSPYAVLGVPRSASVAEIKKAYARLLKQNRPDEDPVAFQNLQQAYEACIGRARQRAERQAGAVAVEVQGKASASPESEGQTQTPAGEIPRPPPKRPPLFPPPPASQSEPPTRRSAGFLEPAMPAARQQALFDEILGIAATQGAEALSKWLHTCEDWYSLQAKAQSVAPLVERLARDGDKLDLDSLKLLIEFFDLAPSQLDPRLRRLGQHLFDRENFLRGLKEVKRRHQTWIDGLLWRELTTPHHRLRRLALLAAPTMASRLRSLALQVLGLHEDLALTVLQEQALGFWMPLTDPQRMGWRAVLSALAQILTLVAPIVGALVWMAGEGWFVWSVFTGELAVFGMLIWLLRRGYAVASHRLALWRLKRTGSMEQLAGGSVLQDPVSVIVMAIVLVTLVVCGLRYLGIIQPAGSEWVLILAFTSLPFVVVYGRLRWEFGLLALTVVVAVNQAIQTLVPVLAEPAGNDLALAVCAAALVCVGMDRARAWREKISLPVARAQFSQYSLLAAMFFVLAMALMPTPEIGAPRAASQPPVAASSLPEPVAAAQAPVAPAPAPTSNFAGGLLHPVEPDTSFPTVAAAFQAVLRAAEPSQGVFTRMRDFRIDSGPLRGAWSFSGGAMDTLPTRFSRVIPSQEAGKAALTTWSCEDSEGECRLFRFRVSILDQRAVWEGMQPGGQRSFDSPGVMPRGCECGPPEQVNGKQPAGTSSWAQVTALYDERGRVLKARIERSSGDPDFDAAALAEARHWRIRPGLVEDRPEGGVVTVTVEYHYRSSPPPES